MGKGSKRRPRFISKKEYDDNYERIFGQKNRTRSRSTDKKPERGNEQMDNQTDEVVETERLCPKCHTKKRIRLNQIMCYECDYSHDYGAPL